MKNTALKINQETLPLSADEFENRLREIGKERYHDNWMVVRPYLYLYVYLHWYLYPYFL